jgi:hypothetical protein
VIRNKRLPRSSLAVEDNRIRWRTGDGRTDFVGEILDVFVTTNNPVLIWNVIDVEQFSMSKDRVATIFLD